MSSKEGSHLCVLCNNKLESKEALKEHFRKHANKEIDSKGLPRNRKQPYGQSTTLTSDSNNSDDKESYISEITKGANVERGIYIKGSASKFVTADVVCDICGESFKCNTLAIQHMFRKHPNSATKHYCPQCGMQFPLKIHRDNHLSSHKLSPTEVPEDSVLHVCEVCNVSFYNNGAYEYHYKSVHKRMVSLFKPIVTPPPSKKIRINNAGEPQSVFYCHLCGIEYIVKFNLQKHLERQHSAEERDAVPSNFFKCTTCDALFYNEKAYQNHNMYHKPDDLYVTSEEQRLQTVRRVDQDFDIRRVQTTAEKYVPIYRCRRKAPQRPADELNKHTAKKQKGSISDDELSPPSDYDSSSDDEEHERGITRRCKENSSNSDIENDKNSNSSSSSSSSSCASSSSSTSNSCHTKTSSHKRNKSTCNTMIKCVKKTELRIAET